MSTPTKMAMAGIRAERERHNAELARLLAECERKDERIAVLENRLAAIDALNQLVAALKEAPDGTS